MTSPEPSMVTFCPICGEINRKKKSIQTSDYISGSLFNLACCQLCGSLWTISPRHEECQDYYGKEYYNSQRGKFSSAIEKIFRFNHIRNAKKLHLHFPAKNILEIGCGRGYLLRELKHLGASVYCLESADAPDWILSNKEIQVATHPSPPENSWPFLSNFFQLIIFWHVLEHLPDPTQSLRQAYRCLASDGTLCISAPNISSLQARLHPATWFHLDAPRHLFHFSIKGLTSLLEKEGYHIIKIVPGDRLQNLFGWLQSVANLLTPHKINSIFRLIQGGPPLRGVNKPALLIQILTSWIWIPLGILGFCIEEICKNYGTITIYAKKHS